MKEWISSTFARLTDFDFEEVCKDLFEEVLHVPLELFARGKDEGVDLRHYGSTEGHIIVQCKHWLRSGSSALVRHLRSVELPKVRILQPDRYIVATTTPLSKSAKDTIAADLQPYVLGPRDIYGGDEIASLLRGNSHIVKNHLRLWLSSSSVLQVLLNKALYVRANDLSEDLQEALKTYAPNAAYNRARDLLEADHVCVIAGEPGIGKTTLAQVLTAGYAAAGYRLADISFDSGEIDSIWLDDQEQVFYYDDFLGQTTLEDKLNKNEDSRLLRLMRKVRGSSNKRLIMTTREYILAQARQRYEKLSRDAFSPLTCVVGLADYTRRARAEILYNHVYYSDLTASQKGTFSSPAVYNAIISHPNFSPRLLVASLDNYEPLSGSAPHQAILQNLTSPNRIWAHIVENQLADAEVDILEILFGVGVPVQYTVLAELWDSYREARIKSDRAFRRAIDVLEGSLIQITAKGSARIVGFSNPSVRDFMRDYCAARDSVISRLVGTVDAFEVVSNLWRVATGHNGEALLACLELNGDHFASAARDLLTSDPISSDYEWGRCARLQVMVEICDHFDRSNLVEFVANEISLVDSPSWTESASELISLVNTVAASANIPISEQCDRLATAAARHIYDDVVGPTFDQLQSMLEELSMLPDTDEVCRRKDDIDGRLLDEAVEQFQRWDSGTNPPTVDEMKSVVEFASGYTDPADMFPGFENAYMQIEEARSLSNLKSGPVPRFVEQFDLSQEKAISQMLGSLGEDLVEEAEDRGSED